MDLAGSLPAGFAVRSRPSLEWRPVPSTMPAPTRAGKKKSAERSDSAAREQGGLQRSLLHWYDKHGRDLPWRENNDPYRVWLSEIMLQQTRVAAVVEKYIGFLNLFPTLEGLGWGITGVRDPFTMLLSRLCGKVAENFQ
jgi:hypothetical protein